MPIAGTVAGDYGTEPVLYSQAEFAQLAKTLQDLPGPARAAWFAQFTRSIGDPALVQSTLRGLSVHSRAIALAGQLQFEESQVPGNGSADAWGGDGKLNAAQLIFTGDALIKAGGVAMPPESETRSAFRAAFGDI